MMSVRLTWLVYHTASVADQFGRGLKHGSGDLTHWADRFPQQVEQATDDEELEHESVIESG